MKLGARVYVYGGLLLIAAALGIWRYTADRPTGSAGVRKVDGEPLPDVAAVASMPDPMAISTWLAERAKRYRGLMDAWHCEWLVVPVQVETLGFDHATRFLMSGDVARTVADVSPCVTDPYLVDRALGEGLRRYKNDEVVELAKAVHAKAILWTYAGHDRQSHMRVTFRVDKRSDDTSDFAPAAAKSFEDLAYSKDVSPFEAFDANLHKMLATVGISAPVRPKVSAGALPAELPETPDAAIKDAAKSPLDEAGRLVLLGILAPRTEFHAPERLFAKALLDLDDAQPDDAVRRMQARILLHLQERPYAIKALGDAKGPEADGLRALSNGDLPAARAAFKNINDPWERAFLRFEIYDLEAAYGRNDDTANGEILAAFGPPWAALANARLAEDDIWLVPDLVELKRSLDVAFPLPGQSLSDIMSGNAAIAQFDDRPEYDLAAARHVRGVLAARPKDLGCCAVEPKPTRGDLLDLYDSRVDAGLLGRAKFYANVQGRYDAALDLLDRYAEALAGNPSAEITRAYTYWYQYKQGNLRKGDMLKTKMRDAARISVAAAGGQEIPASSGLWFLMQPPAEPYAHAIGDAYCEDYPMRASWPGTPATLESRLLFSTDNFEPLSTLIANSKGAQRDAWIAELQHRFIGNSDATSLRLKAAAGDGDPDPATIRTAIANDPDDWTLYSALSWIYIKQGKYSEAADVARSFPRFAMRTRRTVELGNHAFNIGNALYYQGAVESARPLLKIAADYDNGSSSSIVARARIALLDADYGRAAAGFLTAARRYQSLEDFRDYLEIMFAGGESEAGWAGFRQLVRTFKGPAPWVAAMIGHRRDNTDEAALRAWLTDESKRTDRPEGDEAVVTNAMMEQLTDREVPADDFPAFIANLAGPSRVHARGGAFWGSLGQDRERRIGPSEFGHERRKAVKNDVVVPNRFALFATAYSEFRHGHFDASVAAFDELATYYDIESTDEWGFALPYFALAAAQSGDTLGLEKYLRTKSASSPQWGAMLALAVFDAVQKRPDDAGRWLDRAFRERVASGFWPLSTSYEYADISVALYEVTKDERYKRRALAWAEAHREIEPMHAWAHALVARYGADETARRQALATALYLDPRSQWASEVAPANRTAALEWLKKHPPFHFDPKAEAPGTASSTSL